MSSLRIGYVISAGRNPLYGGRFGERGGYQTYGQQSFILDLVSRLLARGDRPEFILDGPSRLPVVDRLAAACPVFVLPQATHRLVNRYDILLVDEASDALVERLPAGPPAVRIVHHAWAATSTVVRERCARFVCMSERALDVQSQRLGPGQPVLIRQGVDLGRFVPDEQVRPQRRVLIMSRLDGEKADTVTAAMEQVADRGWEVTLIGDGQARAEVIGRAPAGVCTTRYVPCYEVQRLLPHFDAVISSGRGAIEALAAGRPAVVAGYGYGGEVTPDNVASLMRTNMTGAALDRDLDRLSEDLEDAVSSRSTDRRALAAELFSADRFIEQTLAAL